MIGKEKSKNKKLRFKKRKYMKNSNYTIKILHIKGAWTQNPSTECKPRRQLVKGIIPPWYLIVLFVRICSKPPRTWERNIRPRHLDSWDSNPRFFITDAPIGCDGSPLCRGFNARPVAMRKYHYVLCLSWPSLQIAAVTSESFTHSLVCTLSWLVPHGTAEGMEMKRCYSVVKEQKRSADNNPFTY